MRHQILSPQVSLIHNFLSAEECAYLISLSEEIGYEKAKVNVGGKEQKLLTQVRNNDRAFHNDEELAQIWYEKAQPFLTPSIGKSEISGFNELFRFYRYHVGQRFKGHLDGSYVRNAAEASYYTFMIYLNDDYEGGTTTFSSLDLEVVPEAGTALVFLHQTFHEGTAVTQGTKYVIRTDVMYCLKDVAHFHF